MNICDRVLLLLLPAITLALGACAGPIVIALWAAGYGRSQNYQP